jgi:CRP-like cAMP-binding protein
VAPSLTDNRILAGLSRGDRDALRPMLGAVVLPLRERLATRGEPMAAVYFLTSGIASIVGQVAHEAPTEVGIIGREGFAGLAVLLAGGVASLDIVMQVEGAAWRIPADRLGEAVDTAPGLRTALLRYSEVIWAQAASTAVANGRASTAERLARCLLMCHDRTGPGPLPLTHEVLAFKLAARRPSVSLRLRGLERAGLIAQHRGRIEVLDRPGLLELAGPYYGMAEAEYDRLLGAKR